MSLSQLTSYERFTMASTTDVRRFSSMFLRKTPSVEPSVVVHVPAAPTTPSWQSIAYTFVGASSDCTTLPNTTVDRPQKLPISTTAAVLSVADKIAWLHVARRRSASSSSSQPSIFLILFRIGMDKTTPVAPRDFPSSFGVF